MLRRKMDIITTYQVLYKVAIKTRNNNAQQRSQNKESGVEEDDGDLFGLPARENNTKDGAKLEHKCTIYIWLVGRGWRDGRKEGCGSSELLLGFWRDTDLEHKVNREMRGGTCREKRESYFGDTPWKGNE